MKRPAAPQTDPAIVALLHRSGSTWHALISGPRGTAAAPAISQTREFARDQVDRIGAWLDEQHAGTVLCVLPSSQVICRTTPLPDAPAAQLDQALRLQAEAHLLGVAPPHRVAMAVLPAAAGEAARSGLVLAWPESSAFEAPVRNRRVEYVADIAALAALLNGQRPGEPLLYLDRGDGSVALALTHAGGALFRSTREQPDDAASWQKTVGRVVAETSLSVGQPGSSIESIVQAARQKAASLPSGRGRLFLPAEIILSAARRVQGAPAEDSWWGNYGVAAGALLARSGPLAALTAMQQAPPVEKPSPVRAIAESLARPRTAAIAVIASILVLLFGPMVFAGLRLAALSVRYGDIDQELRSVTEARHQRDIYRELEKQKTWPMTKLLSDVATNVPLGIELDMMRIEAGKDFAISGTVISSGGLTPQEVVAKMHENLSADRLFENFSVNFGDANNLGVMNFDLSGKVAQPYRVANYPKERDFGDWTAADRRDNKPARSERAGGGDTEQLASAEAAADGAAPKTARAPVIETDETSEAAIDEPAVTDGPETIAAAEAGDTRPTRGSRSRGSSALGSDTAMPGTGGEGGGALPPSADIPLPVTPEEINAMDHAQVKDQLGKVSRARQYVRDNPELEARLKTEFDLLMTRLKEVSKPPTKPEGRK